MQPLEAAAARIRAALPEPIESVQLIDTGWTNRVFEVNGRFIFRFVRDPANTQIAVERAFLPLFAPRAPVAVPHPLYDDVDYIAYRKIPGARFAPDKFAAFTPAQQAVLISRLGAFLKALHNFQFTHPALSAAPYGGGDFWRELWPLAKSELSARTQSRAERFFTRVYARATAVPFAKTITHSDLATNNVLVDYENRHLGGIIDFGDVCVADPAVDFAGFYRRFGRSFVETLLRHYHRPVADNFWARIEFEAKRKIFFVLYFALHHGYEAEAPNIVRTIETLFQDDESN